MTTQPAHDRPILVTGAGGAIGGIGRNVTAQLLEKGYKVRALVRKEDDRADELRRLGAEVVVGDLTDLASMHRAIEGCSRIYFGMSVSAAYLEATVNVAAVARHHGVEAIVNMSQMTVTEMSITETTDSPQHKLHWLAEQVLQWSGLPVVTVRPTAFLESFFLTPRFVGERIGLHPLAVIFALLAFGQLFGFCGVLLALPVSAILATALRELRRRYLASALYES